MFTGLVGEVGTLTRLEQNGDVLRLGISAPRLCANGLNPGDSVAVNGICLTVTGLGEDGFTVQAMRETGERTTLPDWRPGRRLNLERPLTLQSFLDGHLVTGHVDGVARVSIIIPEGHAKRIYLQPPAGLARFIARKGSVALDGASLTVASVEEDGRFSVGVIPHTLGHTTLTDWRVGHYVNLEVDILARYLDRLQQCREDRGGLTLERLMENGF